MTDEKQSTDFEREAARRYRQAAESLDPGTRSALRRARERALEGRTRDARRWVPAGAVAAGAGALVVGALVLRGGESPVGEPVARVADDFELLLEGEDLDLLAELDFYLWLESEPDVG